LPGIVDHIAVGIIEIVVAVIIEDVVIAGFAMEPETAVTNLIITKLVPATAIKILFEMFFNLIRLLTDKQSFIIV
jgi:hypothetical protein